MGKKKKKHKDYDYGIYDEDLCKDIANHLEAYVNAVDDFAIVDGKPVKNIKKALDVIRKTIKHLRNGNPEKEIDEEEYILYMEELGKSGLR